MTLPFDCSLSPQTPVGTWSHEKQVWCCANRNAGCVLPSVKHCKLWGDPHIITFDGAQFVFYREGNFWIIKSAAIRIQGRFQNTAWTKANDLTDFSSMTAIVVSGSFIGNHKIEIQSFDHGDMTCDGNKILATFGKTSTCGATITYTDQGELIDAAMGTLPRRVVQLNLPLGVSMQVNRFPNFINAEVIMSFQNGLDGLCGNFNGDPSDEMGKVAANRFGLGVSRSELLFSNMLALHLPTAHVNPKKCSLALQEKAARFCSAELEASTGWTLAECVGDFCAQHGPEASGPATQGSDCNEQCEVDGFYSSCQDRIQTAARSIYDRSPNACSLALAKVQLQCDVCRSCSMEQLKCSAPLPVSGQYDCSLSYNSWQATWSDAKKSWCCLHEQKACVDFDCSRPATNARAWGAEKRSWCCTHQGKACEGPTPPSTQPANGFVWRKAQYGDYSTWEQVKVVAEYPPYPAPKGYIWQHRDSAGQLKWLLVQEVSGQSMPYDCNAGLHELRLGWSASKKAWCCLQKGIACS